MSIERGWYPDPASAHHLRWWSGLQWTQETRERQPDAPPMPVRAQRADDVWLAPRMVECGYLPGVCVRHGRPAVRRQRAPLYSPTPWWVIPLALVSLLLGLLIALAVRTTVSGAWPVCEVCETRRRQHRNAMLWCLATTAVTIAAAIALNSSGWVALDLLLLPAALVFGALSSWNRVTSSVVDRTLGVVRVKSPSAAFAAAVQGAPAPSQAMAYAPQRW